MAVSLSGVSGAALFKVGTGSGKSISRLNFPGLSENMESTVKSLIQFSLYTHFSKNGQESLDILHSLCVGSNMGGISLPPASGFSSVFLPSCGVGTSVVSGILGVDSFSSNFEQGYIFCKILWSWGNGNVNRLELNFMCMWLLRKKADGAKMDNKKTNGERKKKKCCS